MRIPIFKVTKGNKSIRKGDRVYYSPDGSLVHVGFGWLEKDELTKDITDFEYDVDDEYEVYVDKRGEHVIKKEG